MSPLGVGAYGILFFLVLMFLGMPVGFSLLTTGILGYWYLGGWGPMLGTLTTVPYRLATQYTYTALPPFILLGEVAFRAGISGEAYSMAKKWVGHFRGGLALATVGAAAMFSAIVGSSLACCLIMCGICLPEMRAAGYDDRLSLGTVATGAILGPMIPPSSLMIIYSFLTETNLGYLLIGGIMPGLMLTALYAITVVILVKQHPEIATAGPRSTWKERIMGFPSIWGIAVVFIVMLGGIYMGIVTPTEAGALGCTAVIILGLLRRGLTWKAFLDSLLAAGRTAGTIIPLFMGVYTFNAFLAITRIPNELGDLLLGLNLPPMGIMAMIMVMYLITGCFMDCMAVVFVTVPILFPVVVHSLGMDPVWFGVLIVLVAGIGAITPPYGVIVFAIKGVCKDVPMWTIFRGAMPFVWANLVGMVLLFIFPQIAYWLPYLSKPQV